MKTSAPGLVKPNEVLSFSIVLGSFGVLFAAYLGSWALLTELLCVAMIIAYRAKLKKLERVSAAFVGGYIGLIFIYAGFAVGSPTWLLAIFAMMVFLSATGRETMRNLAERVGNSSLGAGTETATEGYAAGGRQSGITFLAATAVSLLPVFRGLVSSSYIPLAVICGIWISIDRILGDDHSNSPQCQEEPEIRIDMDKFWTASLCEWNGLKG